MLGVQDHAAVADGDVFPEQAFHFLRTDARKDHQGRSSHAASVKFIHARLEKLGHFFQRQGGNFLLPQEGRIHTEDGVFITPSALDGEGEDAAQDEPRLVPLTGRGEGVHQDALAFLHAQVPEGRVLQFRVALLELVDDAPDVRQRPGTAMAFGTQAFHGRRTEADGMVFVLDGVQSQGDDFPAPGDGADFISQGLLDFQYQPCSLDQGD